MKRLLIIIAFVLMGCVTTQPKVEVKTTEIVNNTNETMKYAIEQQKNRLTKADVAKILAVAVNDIEKQGCKAMFLSERGAYIWAWCKDKTIRYYNVEPLVKKYREWKKKEDKDDTNNRKQ